MEMNYDDLSAGFVALARHASVTPRPRPPEMIPGLPGVNAARLEVYRCRLIAWKVGKAEALMNGLPQ